MDHFQLRDGILCAEAVPLTQIAAEVGTPAYVYSTATLQRHAQVMQQALAEVGAAPPLIAFAVKANANLAVLSLLGRAGLGADVVSGGELRRALQAGIAPARIVFSGVGKSDAELEAAIAAGILQINVESASELQRLSAVAVRCGQTVEIALRINPDVDAHTHEKIATGKAENKFGIPIARAGALYAEAAQLPGIRPVGLACHIGSQLLQLQPFASAFAEVGACVAELRAAGLAVSRVDLGGGLGIPYDPARDRAPTPADYGAMVKAAVAAWPDRAGLRFIFEPGRVIAGNAGVLLTRVVAIKTGDGRHAFVVVDAAMNDLMRPALYDAWHEIVAVAPRPGGLVAAVVGPVCESGDTFARDRQLGGVREGDLLAIRTAGAYGATMAGTYNLRPLVAETLVDGARFAVVRPRQTLDDLLGRDRLPVWM